MFMKACYKRLLAKESHLFISICYFGQWNSILIRAFTWECYYDSN